MPKKKKKTPKNNKTILNDQPSLTISKFTDCSMLQLVYFTLYFARDTTYYPKVLTMMLHNKIPLRNILAYFGVIPCYGHRNLAWRL